MVLPSTDRWDCPIPQARASVERSVINAVMLVCFTLQDRLRCGKFDDLVLALAIGCWRASEPRLFHHMGSFRI